MVISTFANPPVIRLYRLEHHLPPSRQYSTYSIRQTRQNLRFRSEKRCLVGRLDWASSGLGNEVFVFCFMWERADEIPPAGNKITHLGTYREMEKQFVLPTQETHGWARMTVAFTEWFSPQSSLSILHVNQGLGKWLVGSEEGGKRRMWYDRIFSCVSFDPPSIPENSTLCFPLLTAEEMVV